MAKAKRNIGLETIEGIHEIKRGEHGRVINIPALVARCSCLQEFHGKGVHAMPR